MGGAMERRDFVRSIPARACAAAAALGAVASAGCAGAPYLVPRTVGERLAVAVADVAGSSGVFVTHPRSDRPIFLSADGSGGWSAVHARCTHRGCQPEPVADRLVCPCHGSEFGRDGTVLEGPARTDLSRLPVVRQGPDLLIALQGGA